MGYVVLRWLFRQVLRLGFGLRVTGEEHVPVRGPAILAPNHASQIDPIILGVAIPRRCTYLVAAELLTMPILGPLVRPFHPVAIKRGAFDRHALAECLARLARGEALVIFPEGKISTDGRLQRPHDGLAFLACRSGVPVIPVGVRGTYQVWPLGTRLPHRGKVAVHVGKPIIPNRALTRETQMALTARVMDEIAGLAGETINPRERAGLRDAAG